MTAHSSGPLGILRVGTSRSFPHSRDRQQRCTTGQEESRAVPVGNSESTCRTCMYKNTASPSSAQEADEAEFDIEVLGLDRQHYLRLYYTVHCSSIHRSSVFRRKHAASRINEQGCRGRLELWSSGAALSRIIKHSRTNPLIESVQRFSAFTKWKRFIQICTIIQRYDTFNNYYMIFLY